MQKQEWESEHIQATQKGRFNTADVPWWTSVRFDVQAITDPPCRYLSETEYFQFPKCKPSFFFFPGIVDGLLQAESVEPLANFALL